MQRIAKLSVRRPNTSDFILKTWNARRNLCRPVRRNELKNVFIMAVWRHRHESIYVYIIGVCRMRYICMVQCQQRSQHQQSNAGRVICIHMCGRNSNGTSNHSCEIKVNEESSERNNNNKKCVPALVSSATSLHTSAHSTNGTRNFAASMVKQKAECYSVMYGLGQIVLASKEHLKLNSEWQSSSRK